MADRRADRYLVPIPKRLSPTRAARNFRPLTVNVRVARNHT